MSQYLKTNDPSLVKDKTTGALLNTNNAALAEYKMRKASLHRINSLETNNRELDQRLGRMERDMAEIKSLLLQAIKE